MTARSKTLRYALTGALAGILLAGTAYAGNPARDAARSAKSAQAALVKGDYAQAVTLAEAAVAASPQDAGMRALLGQAYLRAGRFGSAAETLGEARQLGDDGARTALGLALAQVGLGNARGAVSVLDASRDVIAADDLGLAYALAGEAGRGVAILTDAVRSGEATPKLRQNLAYAYALDGHWGEARIMMIQDVPAEQIDARLTEWAGRARPEDAPLRVAALLGAPMAVDAGRPASLALVAPAESEQLAQAPEPVAAPVVAAGGELPAVADADDDVPPSLAMNAPAPVAEAPAPVAEAFSTAFATPVPAMAMSARAVVQPMPAAVMTRPVRAKPVARAAAPAVGGNHLVQLGSFSSEANARRAWATYTARNANLRNYRLTITPVTVRGKNFWRVAAAGFSSAGASGMCSTVKARGGACFAYAAGRPMASDVAPRFADAGGAGRARRR